MNRKHLLIVAAFLILASGCSFPSAKPTPFPLPATPNFKEAGILPPPASSADLRPVSVTASASLPDSPPAFATDGNPETIWNSGAGPEQWIQLDLGQPFTVRAIRLVVAQYPEGETVHQVWAGADPNNLTLVHEFKGFTKEPDILEFLPSAPLAGIQFIKIVTMQSSSWVAWKEIEVTGK